MIATRRQVAVFIVATLLMAGGLISGWTHPRPDARPVVEMCCFGMASALLAFFVVWLWRARREGVRLFWIVWVAVLEELVCLQEFFYRLSQVTTTS